MPRITPEDFDRATATSPTPSAPTTNMPSVVWTTPAPTLAPPAIPVQPNAIPLPAAPTILPVAQVVAPQPWGWRIMALTMLLAATVNGLGWWATHATLADIEYQLFSATVTTRIKDERIKELEKSLETEKAQRRSLAQKAPLALMNLQLYNADKDGKQLSTPNTTFSSAELRYLQWHCRLRNNLNEGKTLTGEIYIKYFRPDGTLMQDARSPYQVTLQERFSVERETTLTNGWGNNESGSFRPGTHTIEFWWNGNLLEAQKFTVE